MSKTRVSYRKKVIADLAEVLAKIALIEALIKTGADEVLRGAILKDLQELKTKIVELLGR
jgi:hypothetical protein